MPTFVHGKGSHFSWSTAAGTTSNSTTATYINLSSGIEEVSLPRSVDTAEVTTYGDNDRNYIAGLRSGTVSVTGIFASTYEEKIAPALGSTKLGWISFGPAGNAVASRRELARTIITGYEVGAPFGDKVSMKIDFQITGPVKSTKF